MGTFSSIIVFFSLLTFDCYFWRTMRLKISHVILALFPVVTMAASIPGKNGTEIKETSKNKSMPIAKSELNDTNSMNVYTQVTNPLKAKNDTVNATDKDASLKNVVNEIREGTEIKETSKNKSMPIAKSELNDTNS